MKKHIALVTTALVLTLTGTPALAGKACTTKMLAGKWVFATGIGRQALGEPFPPDKDISAIGTFNVARDGALSGSFDVTVQDFGFIPGVEFSGSLMVNPDCTGTVSFATSVGSVRTDSIVVVNRREILGMSQDPANLWTYQVRRIAGPGRANDD